MSSGKGTGQTQLTARNRPAVAIDDWTCHAADHIADGKECCWDRDQTHLVYDVNGARAQFRFSPETQQWYKQTSRGPRTKVIGGPAGAAAELDRRKQENAKLRAQLQRLKDEREGRQQDQPLGGYRDQPSGGSDFSRGQVSWIDSSTKSTYGAAIGKGKSQSRDPFFESDGSWTWINPSTSSSSSWNPQPERGRDFSKAREVPTNRVRSGQLSIKEAAERSPDWAEVSAQRREQARESKSGEKRQRSPELTARHF